ncbi:MAG TPA: sugar ABC transporter substrate-binding protein [Kineosporiaceae bacterium]|nr:sugar ABC transporter substrate-binding protein [Kineosporiaceae bacterium]
MTSTRTTLTRRVSVVATALIIGVALASCASSTSDDGGTDTGTGTSAAALDAALQKGGKLTYWSWTPSAKAQVEAFEKAYPKVDVTLENVGTGNDEYTKLQNAVTAGSGAPDVAQIEYFAMPQFALSDALLDISPYGAAELKAKYTESTWNHVAIGGKIYGLPQDSGPMAMFYNAKVFKKYGIEVPKTWAEYITAAKKLHAADSKKFIAADTGDAGFTTSMIWQAGGHPFAVDGTKATINVADAGTKKWADSWNQLVDGGLLSTIPAWSDAWYKGLSDGTISTLVTGAWMPGVFEGSVAKASGDWAVAPMPTYDGTPVTAENGGGAQAVLKQTKEPALATAFLRWLNSDPASLKVFTESGGFPSTVAELKDPAFVGAESKYFGGQKINEVLTAAAGEVAPNWSYLPFQVYANSIFNDNVGQSYEKKEDLNKGLAAWQTALVTYGNAQGFKVNS